MQSTEPQFRVANLVVGGREALAGSMIGGSGAVPHRSGPPTPTCSSVRCAYERVKAPLHHQPVRAFAHCQLCGRYWDRTSDLSGVNGALSR
jgi:hypothetical protein